MADARPRRTQRGGFAAIQIEPAIAARTDCTVVIDSELRLECAALPSVAWLVALSAALSERGR